jgi:hypothetical protein
MLPLSLVTELSDDSFSSAVGTGRGTAGRRQDTDESATQCNQNSLTITTQQWPSFVIAYPNGKFFKRNEHSHSGYESEFFNCSYFATEEDALHHLRNWSPRGDGAVKKLVAATLHLEDI